MSTFSNDSNVCFFFVPLRPFHIFSSFFIHFTHCLNLVRDGEDVVSLKAVENVTLPFGWTGPERGRGYIGAAGTGVYVDKHPDGSRTLLWRVRLLDYDCETGHAEKMGKEH